MLDEQCHPWLAIPEEANAYWNLDVLEVIQSRRSDQPPLSIVVASQWPDSELRNTGAWRIAFTWFKAYRSRSYDYPGNLPLTRLDERSALWEIFPSAYLRENSMPDGIEPGGQRRFHHFVICTGGFQVYEVVATEWSAERLSDEWAQPFTYPAPR